MDKDRIKEEIKYLLDEKSVDAFAYCSAAYFDGLEDSYAYREEAGLSCDFENRTEVVDLCEPGRLLTGAKSFLVILIPHSPYTLSDNPDVGKMASGTASEDYHEVVRRVLRPIKDHLYEKHRVESEIIVDTSPLSDRAIAVRSGLGIIRRNNMFYHKKYGSYVHIGALLISEDLHAGDSKKINDPCGHCRRCVAACPGEAILGDGTINSNKCVSYLTQKKVLTETESTTIGAMIYGCDICQRVCPINQGITKSEQSLWVNAEVDLVQLLYISNKAFASSYKTTSAGWRGKRTLQRNAIAAMGNSGNKDFCQILEKQLLDQRSIIRDEAERALHKLNHLR